MKATFTRSARRIAAEAAVAYSHREPKTVEGFRVALRAAVEHLEQFPEAGVPVAETEFRRFSLSPYPYSLIYQVLPSSVRIVSVPHNHQSTETWLRNAGRP